MASHGGFRHNTQSLRVVEELDLKYPVFNGLNLTWEVREGLHKPYVANRLTRDLFSRRSMRSRSISPTRSPTSATISTTVSNRA